MALTAKKRAIWLLLALVAALVVALAASCTSTSSMPADAGAAAGRTPAETSDAVEADGTETDAGELSESPSSADSASGGASDEGLKPSASTLLEGLDRKALKSLLGKDTAELLVERAESNASAAWIATHADVYAQYGSELQVKLLKLAADDPLAIAFVRNFPQLAYADGPDYDATAMDEEINVPGIPKTPFPHLYQWDLRWGYTQFSADGFGLAGCGPTSLTMVYQGLTGKKDITPYDMGKLAEDQGYVIYGQGSTSGLFTEMPWQLGLSCWEVPVDAASIVETLRAGNPIIANVGAGYFSTVGHFFVLAGITDDGQVILNDPYSVERSSRLWDPEFMASESKALFAYGLAQADTL